MKDRIISYFKIFGALMMISPLLFSFFALDFGVTVKTFTITYGIISGLTLIGILMFNYLEGYKYDKRRI